MTLIRDVQAVIRYVGGEHDGDLDVYRIASDADYDATFRNPPLDGTPKQAGYVVEEIRSAFTHPPLTTEETA
jgi:hypothetical protein